MARFERLAKELETLVHRQEELKPILNKVRDENYPVEVLVNDLKEAKLGFFAWHLGNGDYNENDTQESSTPPEDNGDSETPENTLPDPTPAPPPSVPQPSTNDEQAQTAPIPIDPAKLPRCTTCEKGNYPQDAAHEFMTSDHPYEDPKLSQETQNQNGQ